MAQNELDGPTHKPATYKTFANKRNGNVKHFTRRSVERLATKRHQFYKELDAILGNWPASTEPVILNACAGALPDEREEFRITLLFGLLHLKSLLLLKHVLNSLIHFPVIIFCFINKQQHSLPFPNGNFLCTMRY